MRELSSTIHIEAPIEKVWQVLVDFTNWTDWNPMVNHASGSPTIGAKLGITMRAPDGKDGAKYQPTVMEATAPNKFLWQAKIMGGILFTNNRVFELKESNGGTELINREEFSGLMVPLFWSKMQVFVVPVLENMNKALKEKVEG